MAIPTETSWTEGRGRALRAPTREAVLRWALTLAVGGGVLAAVVAAGVIDGSQATLVVMGFDPDRAMLITALVVAALVGGAATFVTGLRLPAAIADAVAYSALYVPTFLAETRNALHASGTEGAFSPSGWLVTIVALVTVGIVVAWAGPTLALDARRGFLSALAVAGSALRERRFRGQPVGRPIVAVALIAALVVGLPAFGDLVNYSPDTLMLSGHGGPGLAGGGDAGSNSGGLAAANPSESPNPSGDLAPPYPSGSLEPISSSPAPYARPWASHVPSGSGTVQTLSFPAPWTGGSASHGSVWVYLPPGYATSPSLHYATVYEAPWGVGGWDKGIGITAMLDSLITSGRIAPTIFVFVSETGGPYFDSECMDSYDGRERVETYIVDTVVPYVDANYRTIPKPAARAIFGFSQGGWCSAMLLFRHPDVFGTSISFSGYFHSAPNEATTVNAHLVFGNNQALMDSHSAILVAPTLPPATVKGMYVILVGDESQAFYGPEMIGFTKVLQQYHYPMAVLTTNEGHSWVEVRHMMPSALDTLFAHFAQSGIYNGVY